MRTIFQFIFLALFVGCQPTTSEVDQILFSSNRSGNSDIYLITSENYEPIKITSSELEEWGPVWINDDEISFLRQGEDSISIVHMNLSTKLETILKHPSDCILDDKNKVYYHGSSAWQCNGNLYIQKVDGELLTPSHDLDWGANYISWVDERTLSFTSSYLGDNEIFTYNFENGLLTQITNNPANDERGDFSLDGKYVVFSSDRFERGNQDIVLKNLETQEVVNISNARGFELIARWGSDSKTIYYGGTMDGNWEMYRYNLLSKETQRITNNDAFDGDPRILRTDLR